MSQSELLTLVTETLKRIGIEHMVTGSLASSLYGEPRATHDIDLVVRLDESHVGPLLAAFPPPRFYLSEQGVREALGPAGMFNLVDLESGIKVDFWRLTPDAFDQARFRRRRTEAIDRHLIPFAAPEDIILAKLNWARLCGGSEKQMTDAIRVYETQHGALDKEYLEEWVKRLNLEAQWQDLKNEARPILPDH